MPRNRCKNCGKKFSADSTKCPKCGELAGSSANPGMILLAMAGVIIVIMVIIMLIH